MKKAKFLVSHFDATIEKFKAGEVHDLTDETRLCIARGAAVEVEVVEEAQAPAAEAEAPVAEPAADAPVQAAAKKK